MPQWISKLINWIFNPPLPIPVPIPVPVPVPVPVPDMVNAINNERKKAGKAPLIENGPLNTTAQAWANHLASIGVLDHGNFTGRIASVFPNTAAGEDIAEGQPTVAAVVASWMSSPGHRANILGNYNRIGSGYAQSTTGHTFWVVDFVEI